MANKAGLTVLFLGLTVATGCLQKETTHTLYLSPDGAVRWTVEESNVRSDEEDEGRRFAEEQAYIGPALIGAHRVALGLQAVGPDGLVRTQVLRDERPFHVVTDASFARGDRAFERLFREAGVRASVTAQETDGRRSLRVRFDFTRDLEDRDSPAAALLEDLENFRFILTGGRFVEGGGFDVLDRTRAVISRSWLGQLEKAVEARQSIDLHLSWEAGAW